MVTFWQEFILLVGVGLFLFGLFGIALQDRWGLHPVYLYFWIMSGPVAVAFALIRLHEIRKDFRKGKEEASDPERGTQYIGISQEEEKIISQYRELKKSNPNRNYRLFPFTPLSGGECQEETVKPKTASEVLFGIDKATGDSLDGIYVFPGAEKEVAE